ncbi:energy transducer TonB [Sphingomonas sp. LB-2]|uniref:energy transducer TonB n=1 Tax=Sphingomonas caeni TaxID=2984949 RepID=UPI00223030DE|nr:energy transducer TonB [Sphingomonas caeni]MCW3849248.1 energy transducer TonB [Sphingomonas caeni]
MIFLTILASATMVQPQAAPCGPPPNGSRPWVSSADYPREARRKNMRGVVTFRLEVSAAGCPTACTIVKSSGYPLLDDTTCELMLARARFKPKLDADGQPVAASVTKQFSWDF